MTFKEFQRLVKFSRKSGILKLKFDGVELELSHESLKPTRRPKIVESDELKPSYTPEQELFWSAGDIVNG